MTKEVKDHTSIWAEITESHIAKTIEDMERMNNDPDLKDEHKPIWSICGDTAIVRVDKRRYEVLTITRMREFKVKKDGTLKLEYYGVNAAYRKVNDASPV